MIRFIPHCPDSFYNTRVQFCSPKICNSKSRNGHQVSKTVGVESNGYTPLSRFIRI